MPCSGFSQYIRVLHIACHARDVMFRSDVRPKVVLVLFNVRYRSGQFCLSKLLDMLDFFKNMSFDVYGTFDCLHSELLVTV